MKTSPPSGPLPKHNMPLNDNHAILYQLLQLPNEAFVYGAYRRLLGRNPDIAGLTRYKDLLKQHGKVLVMAELRASDEGRKMSHLLISNELDRLSRRYTILRSLPLGDFRWQLLKWMCRSLSSSPINLGMQVGIIDTTHAITDTNFATHERDLYWIYKIAGRHPQTNIEQDSDTVIKGDLDQVIRHLYNTSNKK